MSEITLHFRSYIKRDLEELDRYIGELTREENLTEEQQTYVREFLDSGGQEKYLTTHAALMPKESIFTVCKYLLLTDISKHLSHKAESFVRGGAGSEDRQVQLHYIDDNCDFVRYWLSTVHCHCTS
eukprot:m.189629 g.189629  ORF g.189629 m.189629 type:complete len:126 (+) comp39418_c0_seq2:1447-1824(+)